MLPKVVKQNGTHELCMHMYVVVGHRYYDIDEVVDSYCYSDWFLTQTWKEEYLGLS